MKAVKNYIDTIRKGLRNWTEWTENGEELLQEKGWFEFHCLISRASKELVKLDAQDVMDAILEHEEEIGLRLKRLNNYYLLPTIGFIKDTFGTKAQLSDECLNGEINAYRQMIEDKALDLIRVIDECEEYIKPKNPIISKALADPLLLSYFFENKKVLVEYVKYCLSDTNKTQKAYRAKELVNQGKIKDSCKYKYLHDALENIGIDVGSYVNWQQAINKF